MSLDAVVTGASTGIGRSAVKVLVGHGWRVFAGVRKVADAESLRQEFGEEVEPLLFDVTDVAAVRQSRRRDARQARRANPQGTGQQRRLRDRRTARASADRPDSTGVRGQRARRGDGEPGLHSAARRRSLAGRRPGAHRQHQLGRRQDRPAVSRRLRDVEACAGGVQRQPPPRIDDLRHRRRRHRSGSDRHADLGQGRSDRRLGLRRIPITAPC